MNRKWILIAFCGLMVLSAVVSSLRRQHDPENDLRQVDVGREAFSPRQLPITGSNPARHFSNAIADAVEKVMPCVVVVRTERIQYKKLRDYFGFFHLVPEQLAGEGSGVIIDERGYVITSWHVVEGARQIEVVLNDGTKLRAEPVGRDLSTDLAVLKIIAEAMECPAVEFGDSDALRVGEVVIAIGSPFSLQSSVTVGHVSQKGRRAEILPYEDFIQTDAAINEGNSGGPLIDVDGRLIGINAAIKTDAQQKGVGIAFAIPSNLAMVIAKSLIENGKHEWPWVGATFGTIDPVDRKQLFGGVGVPVLQVWRDSSAATAGMQPGDVVLEVNGTAVKNKFDVYRIIFNHPVGDRLEFLVQRGDETQFEYELLLEEFPGVPF
jgi:serine protease Do